MEDMIRHHCGMWTHVGLLAYRDSQVIGEIVGQDVYRIRDIPSSGASEIIVDIGAHVGSFSLCWHKKNPLARIVCVEACPENIDILKANVGEFCEIHQAACTYERGTLKLRNSIAVEKADATGGSIVTSMQDDGTETAVANGLRKYKLDERPLTGITLESLGLPHIDVLKLDCEGCEMSILANADLSRVRRIVGEYHGLKRWKGILDKLSSGWEYLTLSDQNELGIFMLVNQNI